MISFTDWLEQVVENRDIELIKFDDLKLHAKKRKKDGNSSRSCISFNNLQFTYHNLTDFYDINVDEEEMKAIFSMGMEHENIINAFIAQSAGSLEYYLLVEVTNHGNLTNYLKETKLTWDQRNNLALQLISGLKFLHDQSINPNNVFLYGDNLKLTNFGSLTIFKSHDLTQIIPYVEPQALMLGEEFIGNSYGKDNNSSNMFGTKSNIYCFGVLLWQISSGLQPYSSLTPVKMVDHISRGKREELFAGTPVKYYELYQECWQHDPDQRPDCLMAYNKLKLVDINDVISAESLNYEDTFKLDLDFYKSKIHSAPSLYDESTAVETWTEDDSNKMQAVSRDSQNSIKEILTEGGTITPDKAKQPAQIYTNESANPFEILKNKCVSIQELEKIDICLHIPLLNVEYENFKIADGFIKAIEEVLNNPDQKSIQKIFEKYGDYITKKVVIGGALRIKSKYPKDRKSIMEDFDILKASLYWINEQIFSGTSNLFSQVSYGNSFTIEDMNNQRITSLHELKVWMEDIYEYRKGYVIAFNEIIPTHTLLKDEIKQEIIKVCGKLREVKIEHMIVPYITNAPNPVYLNNWAENSPIIHLCHWINNLYLHFGLMVQQNSLKYGSEIALEFLEIPEICKSDLKSYMYLRQPSKGEAFTLVNLINIDNFDIKKVPFLTESLTKLHPIFDNQHKSNEVHCFIASEKIKLIFNKDKLRPSRKFLRAVDEAISSNYPFHDLKNVFDKFGYLCPKSIILGKTFSKIYISDNNDKLINDEHINFNVNIDESRIVEENLIKWSESVKNLDTSFFLDFNGDITNRNEIYFNLKNSYEKQNWRTVTQDVIPLYKILPKAMQNDIESIASDDYHIVMTGFTGIMHNNQTYVNIKFEKLLYYNNYEIFGCLIIDEQNASDVMIRFNLANQYGCRATIHKLDNKSILIGAQIFWLILAKGHGYFSRQSRDIKITHGKEILTGELPINVKISLPTWSNSCIFVTGFDSNNFDKNQIIKSKIKSATHALNALAKKEKESKINHLMTDLSLDVFQYNSETQSVIFEDLTMRWCVIDTYGKDHITVDVGVNYSNLVKWSILGDVITSNVNFKKETAVNQTLSSDYETKVVENTVQPFLPFFQTVSVIIDSIMKAYKNGKCNQKICLALIDRVEIAQQAVKSLQRQQMENEELFRKQDYYNAWVRFVTVLENINKFVKDVTQLSNLQKYSNANAVKDAFDKNIKEFEVVCKDLDFALAIYDMNKSEVENKKIMEDIDVLTKAYKDRVPEIKPKELVSRPSDNDGKTILKRIYRGIEVACIKILVEKDDIKSCAEFAILHELRICPYIIGFHGLSKINNSSVMVLIGLRMMNEFYEPKISNFGFSRIEQDTELKIVNISSMIRWLAPEKISQSQYDLNVKNDHQCEMYSFGMLLWELCYQRIPYENINSAPEIEQLVRNKKREKIMLDSSPIAQELFRIIKQAWNHIPSERPKVMNVLTTLREAYEKYVPKGTSPMIFPKHVSENNISSYGPSSNVNEGPHSDGNYFEEFLEDSSIDNIPAIKTLIPFEMGYKAHQEKNYKTAWECFSGLAECGNNRAKYWKGYYLLSGYHVQKDMDAALKLFKEAADNNVSEAQLRYAFTLIEKNSKEYSEIIKYIKMSADNGNEIALYNLGIIYMEGLYREPINKERAKHYARLAALKNYPKAIELLKKLNFENPSDVEMQDA
ncbi:kinase-like protein [Gigaspora margarita]|uniref:Kinase-like protein n=1 Tax=Gigaspora margarita TaxID=4874 RepID=A0A8H4AX12_GIGMA|nr:kinase-like protein [Gigaspora margarita]